MIIARSPLLQRLHVPSLPLCWEKGAETRRIITFFPSIFELKDRIICWFYSNKQLPTKEKIPCCKLSASASLNSSGKASSDNTLRFCQADCQSKLLMHFNACLVVQYQRCCSRDTDCKRMQYLHLLLLLLFSKLESNPITNLLLKLAWNAAGKIHLLFCSIKHLSSVRLLLKWGELHLWYKLLRQSQNLIAKGWQRERIIVDILKRWMAGCCSVCSSILMWGRVDRWWQPAS